MRINRVGKLGEIYTDTETGKMYKCTYSYKDSNGNVDCTWKEVGSLPTNLRNESAGETEIKEPKVETKSEIESEKISEGKISEKHSERSSDSMSKANGNEEIVNVTDERPVKDRHKTKYTNYSKR